jgi:hypothetical protein
MSKPYIHSQSSARKYGGVPEDYIEIHSFMDCSKGAMADNRHRALTHNSWFLSNILERIHFSNSGPMLPNGTFPTITNSDGKVVSVRDIGEQHILEDYAGRFIPSAQDFLGEMEYKPWMQNGKGTPPSFEKIDKHRKTRVLEELEKIKPLITDEQPKINVRGTLLD